MKNVKKQFFHEKIMFSWPLSKVNAQFLTFEEEEKLCLGGRIAVPS